MRKENDATFEKDYRIAEYNAVKGEVFDCFVSRRHLLTIALIFSATVIGLGLKENSAHALLIVPGFLFVIYIGLSLWTRRLTLISSYIRTEIEPRAAGIMNWEKRIAEKGYSDLLTVSGFYGVLFLVIGLFAMLSAWFVAADSCNPPRPIAELVFENKVFLSLLVVDVVSLVGTLLITWLSIPLFTPECVKNRIRDVYTTQQPRT